MASEEVMAARCVCVRGWVGKGRGTEESEERSEGGERRGLVGRVSIQPERAVSLRGKQNE